MSDATEPYLRPDWPAPPTVGALMGLREAALPRPPHSGPDARAAVSRHMAAMQGASPVVLQQVHGADVVRLGHADMGVAQHPMADAAVCTESGVACTVLVADCLPVLLCDRHGRGVGAAHAGWRGLAAGVLEATVQALCQACGAQPQDLLAWMGPCIGVQAFEVGADVLEAFGVEPQAGPLPAPAASSAMGQAFVWSPRPDGQPRWRADLTGLARQRLAAAGVTALSGGRWCTYSDPSRFLSFRRDGGADGLAAAQGAARMAASVWLRG